MAPLSARCKFLLFASTVLGWGAFSLQFILMRELREKAEFAPRLLPNYNAGNPLGCGETRPFQDYGAPHYGGAGSNIFPPISDEEFRLHLMFDADKFPEQSMLHELLLVSLRFPIALRTE